LVCGVIQSQSRVHAPVDDHGDEHEQHDQEWRRYGDFRRYGAPVSAPPGHPPPPAAVLAARDVRTDRILDEVHATGGDVRRICDLFGLSTKAVQRYTAVLDPPGLIDTDDE
jgi:hypothetical protein